MSWRVGPVGDSDSRRLGVPLVSVSVDQPRSYCWWIQCCGSPGCSVFLPNLSADASESSESSAAKLTITVTITPLPQGVYSHHERGIRSMRSEYFLTRSVHLFLHLGGLSPTGAVLVVLVLDRGEEDPVEQDLSDAVSGHAPRTPTLQGGLGSPRTAGVKVEDHLRLAPALHVVYKPQAVPQKNELRGILVKQEEGLHDGAVLDRLRSPASTRPTTTEHFRHHTQPITCKRIPSHCLVCRDRVVSNARDFLFGRRL